MHVAIVMDSKELEYTTALDNTREQSGPKFLTLHYRLLIHSKQHT